MTASKNSAKDVFLNALEIATPPERRDYVQSECGDDEQLRREVESLLRHEQRLGCFLDSEGEDDPPSGDESPLERPGSRIGPYTLLQVIGEGGMGVVYAAEQKEPVERRVALKIVKPGMDTRQVIGRFQAERQVLAMMDHPNIAKVLDAGMTGSGRPYFVMELVQGISITQYCDEHQLTIRQRLELFVTICWAVQHAHQKGVIHRDLKPCNMLVARFDREAIPKIIDFGIAKALHQPLAHTTCTRDGQVVGTVEYMSPEQAGFKQLDVDTRSDIHALGVVLYELLAGSTPFDKHRLQSASFDEVLRIIRHEEPPRPSKRLSMIDTLPSVAADRGTDPGTLCRSVRGELDWIVMKALDKERGARYQTASALAADVERYLANEPVKACPPSPAYRCRKFVGRNKVAVSLTATIAAILLLAVVGLAVSNTLIRQAYEQVTNYEREKTRLLAISKVNEARALRMTTRLGRRTDALDLLQQAVGYFRSLDALEPLELALRNEAIACMALRAELRPGSTREFPHASWWVAFDADLRRYARLADGGAIAVYEISLAGQHQELVQLPPFANGAGSFRFSPDGKFLATRNGLGSECRVWNVEEPKLICQTAITGDSTGGMDFSGDARLLAVIHPSATIRLFEMPEGTPLRSLEISSPPSIVRFQPRGGLLAVARDRDVEIWNLETRRRTQHFSHQARVTGVDWSDDGQVLAAVAEDHCAYVWHVETGRQQAVLRGGGKEVTLNHRGDLVATWTDTYHTALWDPIRNKQLLNTPGRSIRFSVDGRRLGFNLSHEVGVWEMDAGGEYRLLSEPEGESHVRGITSLPHGPLIASCGEGVHIWEWTTGRRLARLDIGRVESVLFHAPSRSLITSGPNGVHLWNVAASGHQLQLGPPRTVHGPFPVGDWAWTGSAGVSQHDRSMAVVAGNQVLTLDLEGGRQPAALHTASSPALVALSPDGRWAVTGTWHGGNGLWLSDARTGRKVCDLWPGFGASSAVFSPDGQWLVGSRGQEYRAWQVSAWESLSWEPAWTLARDGAVDSPGPAAFSPDSAMVAVRPTQTALRLVETASGREIASLEAPEPVFSIHACFTRDGSAVVELGQQRTIRIWNLHLIRKRLRQLGLDWDSPGDPPASYAQAAEPWAVQVEYGPLAARVAEVQHERHLQRAREYRQDKQYARALAEYQQLLEANADHADGSNELARLYAAGPIELRDTEAALSLARKAVHLAPQNAACWTTLGAASYRAADFEAAVEALTKAMELRQGVDCTNWFFRSMAHWQLGNQEEARQWYDQAISRMADKRPDDEELHRIRAEATQLLNLDPQPTEVSRKTTAGKPESPDPTLTLRGRPSGRLVCAPGAVV